MLPEVGDVRMHPAVRNDVELATWTFSLKGLPKQQHALNMWDLKRKSAYNLISRRPCWRAGMSGRFSIQNEGRQQREVRYGENVWWEGEMFWERVNTLTTRCVRERDRKWQVSRNKQLHKGSLTYVYYINWYDTLRECLWENKRQEERGKKVKESLGGFSKNAVSPLQNMSCQPVKLLKGHWVNSLFCCTDAFDKEAWQPKSVIPGRVSIRNELGVPRLVICNCKTCSFKLRRLHMHACSFPSGCKKPMFRNSIRSDCGTVQRLN